MITLNELPNGNLQIVLDDKSELQELLSKGKFDNDLLCEMLETSGYRGNDWHVPQYIGLTEAPTICYGAIYNDTENDNIEAEDYEKIWYFGDYMIRDLGKELLRDGTFILTKL